VLYGKDHRASLERQPVAMVQQPELKMFQWSSTLNRDGRSMRSPSAIRPWFLSCPRSAAPTSPPSSISKTEGELTPWRGDGKLVHLAHEPWPYGPQRSPRSVEPHDDPPPTCHTSGLQIHGKNRLDCCVTCSRLESPGPGFGRYGPRLRGNNRPTPGR